MIVLDNSVLSAFSRLNLLEELKKLTSTIIITSYIRNEYSQKWLEQLPNWIEIHEINITEKEMQFGLTKSDYSVMKTAKDLDLTLASDDLKLRKMATRNRIRVTGSLGLLKALFQKKVITDKNEYTKLINSLNQDIFLSEDLIKWALDI